MKITSVTASQPSTPGSPPDWRTSLGQILVTVKTDDGLTGLGVGGGGAAGIHVVETVLRDTLLSEDAEDVEGLWERMYRSTLPFGRKGLAIMALSGVDLALWDLRGKREGKPVAEVLGGTVGEPIPTYLTVFDEFEEAVRRGHKAIKLHLAHFDPREGDGRIVDHIRIIREAVGPEIQVMVDVFMKWDVKTTLHLAEQFAEYDIRWIEEPLPPDNLDGYEELSKFSPVPIAGGEHEYTAVGFKELIDRRLHQVLQPDICWCGGMTEVVKIFQMANEAGLQVCPHRGAEIWGLHAIAALATAPLAESGRTWMTWVHGQPEIQEGFIQLGAGFGFGASVDENL